MSDPVTPLNHARFDGYVTVEETGPRGMVTLRGDLSSDTIATAVRDLTDATLPDRGAIAGPDDVSAAWMSPDELLLLMPYAKVAEALSRLATMLDGTHHLAADVSDARATFRLTGPAVREVLAKLTPADLSPEALPPGQIRRTRLAQVAAALWFTDNATAEIVCFRSVARYVFDLLASSARPGSEVYGVDGTSSQSPH